MSARTLLVAVCVLAAPLGAQDARVRAEVDARKVGLDDPFELRIVVEGTSDVSEAPAPQALKNLRVLGGPSVSQQVSLVNGSFSQSRTFTWVLQAQATGVAEIGPVHVKLTSGEKLTAAIPIEVVAGSLGQPGGRQRGIDPFGDDPFAPFFGRERRERRPGPAPKLYVEAVPARTRLYVGEPLLLTYYVYTQVSITDLQFKDAPQYPGFWAEDLEQPKSGPRGETVTVEGETFQRFPIAQKLLFPTRAGKLEIPGVTVRLGVQRQSFFDPGPIAVERATKAASIEAQAIPSEPGFSGAVGRFQVKASLDKTSLAFGEAANLRFELSGSGNLKWVDQGPEVRVPGAKLFPPQTKSDVKASPTGLSGTRAWEYVLVPETAGTLEVPALAFSYFDPAAGKLVHTRSTPLSLRVDAATGGAQAAGLQPPAARGAPSGGLSLRSDLEPPRGLLPELGPRALLIAVALFLAAHAGLFVAARIGQAHQERSGRAPVRSARQALAELKRATGPGLSKEAAAAAIEKALHDVFGPVEDDAGPPADERERTARELLAELRFIRYAPQLGDYSEKLRELSARAEQAVRRWA